MFGLIARFTILLCLPLLDIAATTVLLINGNNWSLFISSIFGYSFSSSFIDIWLLSFIRNSIVLGGVIGVFCNLHSGPKRCERSSWVILTLSFLNAYFVTVKLLSYSDSDDFVPGLKYYWFWGLYGWNLIGSILSIIIWHSLASLHKISNRFLFSKNGTDLENQPLLNKKIGKRAKNGEFFKFLLI